MVLSFVGLAGFVHWTECLLCWNRPNLSLRGRDHGPLYLYHNASRPERRKTGKI